MATQTIFDPQPVTLEGKIVLLEPLTLEHAAGVFGVTRDWLAPAILGAEIESPDQLQEKLAIYKGNLFAKAVLDNAWWSLSCNISGTPLHKALGASREAVPVGADFGVIYELN